MKVICGIHNSNKVPSGAVATIGNFDGVHLGHQLIIKDIVKKARYRQAPSLLITFEPHPYEFFKKNEVPARLTRLREKVGLLKNLNLDYLLCLQFNQALAMQSANAFIKEVLVEKLRINVLVTGEDFKFGYRREGDIDLLKQAANKNEFKFEPISAVLLHEMRISSTLIRRSLQQGDLHFAEKLLGHPYCMQGRVYHGDKRGRELGFPTANILIKREVAPLKGVFAVWVSGVTKDKLPGIANIGIRPTIGGNVVKLEVHLFNFDADLYHKHLTVEFLQKIRDEQKFSSLELLKHQIELDVSEAQSFFFKMPQFLMP